MARKGQNRYLARLSSAAGQGGSTGPSPSSFGHDRLSPEAKSFVQSPGDRLSAKVFSELLKEGYVLPQGRTWVWTPKAKAFKSKAGKS